MTEPELRKALLKAWHLGQRYADQANSESYSENKKSDETREKFNIFLSETCSLLTTSGPTP